MRFYARWSALCSGWLLTLPAILPAPAGAQISGEVGHWSWSCRNPARCEATASLAGHDGSKLVVRFAPVAGDRLSFSLTVLNRTAAGDIGVEGLGKELWFSCGFSGPECFVSTVLDRRELAELLASPRIAIREGSDPRPLALAGLGEALHIAGAVSPSKLPATLSQSDRRVPATPSTTGVRPDAEFDSVLAALAAPDEPVAPSTSTSFDFPLSAPKSDSGFYDDVTDVLSHRDWVSFVDKEICSAAVWASASTIDPYGSPSPAIFFDAGADWDDGEVGMNFAYPLHYDVGSTAYALVDGKRFPLDVVDDGFIDLPVKSSGGFDGSFIEALEDGSSVEIWGTQYGQLLGLRFSALGFTAAFQAMMDACDAPDLAIWLK